jgi:integrase
MMSSYLPADLAFPEAAASWLDSQSLAGNFTRARYISSRTLKDDYQYVGALTRFFAALRLCDIHVGHLRQYQELRASGELGVPEKTVLERCAQLHRCSVEKLLLIPDWAAVASAKVKAAHREVGANKINQELGLLTRILKRASLWTPEFEECYQPLRADAADVPRSLSPDQQQCFLDLAASKQEWQVVYWYALVAFETTATNCEMRGLRLGDVNLYQQVLMVRAASAKNKYRVRTIPLTPNALWAIERIHERARAFGALSPEDCLFPFGERRNTYDVKRPMTNSGIKKVWEAVRTAAGVPWFRIHDLRHTAITRMAEAGQPLAVIMSLAGHISPRMTQHYTQISESAKRKALLETFTQQRKHPVRTPVHSMAASA